MVYSGRDGSLERRFFIQNNYGGCQNDAGWFLVVEKDTCAWEQRTTRPYFLYSGLTGRDLQDSKFYRHLRLTERVSPPVLQNYALCDSLMERDLLNRRAVLDFSKGLLQLLFSFDPNKLFFIQEFKG